MSTGLEAPNPPPPFANRLLAAVSLLGFGWLLLAIGLVADAGRGSPEATVRRYLADLEARQVAAALGALEPAAGVRWRDFVEFQQFNRYRVISIAVRSPSILESASGGRPWRATELTLVADIVEPSGIQWRGSTVVPVAQIDGRWVMRRAPFADGD
jgi:hypothetical protein